MFITMRHINDFSTIILLDHRYKRKDIVDYIPKWIQKSLKHCDNFGQANKALSKFFRAMSEKYASSTMIVG